MSETIKEKSLVRTLAEFSLPLIASGILQQLYSWADAFIVGNIVGESALAAIGATNSFVRLFILAMTGFTSGISILSANLFGAKNEGAQRKLLATFLLVLGGVFTVLAALGIAGTNAMLTLLQTPQDIFNIAGDYLQIILLGIPVMTVYNVYSAVLRSIGDSKAPFYSILVSSVTNVILDIVFVGFFHWGVQGAAYATILAQILMTIFIISYAIRKYDSLRFRFGRHSFDLDLLRRGTILATPITIQSLVTASGNLILQNFMNSFGTPTVAAITTAYRIDGVVMLPITNLSTGIAIITSQNTGAGNHKRARRCLFVGLGMMAVISFCLTAMMLTFSGTLIALFGVTPESTLIGKQFFASLAWFYIIYGAAMAMRGYTEGIGKVFFSGAFGITQLSIRVALSYILRPVFDNMVIAYAEAFSWCALLAMYLIFLFITVSRKKHHRTEETK